MSDVKVKINQLEVKQATNDTDYLVLDDGTTTSRINVDDFKREVSYPLKTLIEDNKNESNLNVQKETNDRINAIKQLENRIEEFKKSFLLNGNGQDRSFLIKHELNSKDLLCSFYDAISGEDLEAKVVRNDVDTVNVVFKEPPINNFRVSILAVDKWTTFNLASNLPLGDF